jgi:hypothetical protein
VTVLGARSRTLPIAPVAPLAQRRLPLAADVRAVDKAWRPIYAVWEITLRCDLACRHCGSRAGRERPEELTTAEALDLVQQMADLGVLEVTLIGGEAYLRDDWTEIARAVRAHGMQCTITTGGRGMSVERARAAKAAGVQSVSVSIDGARDTHDMLRGVRGSFDAAVEAMRNLRQAGISVSVNRSRWWRRGSTDRACRARRSSPSALWARRSGAPNARRRHHPPEGLRMRARPRTERAVTGKPRRPTRKMPRVPWLSTAPLPRRPMRRPGQTQRSGRTRRPGQTRPVAIRVWRRPATQIRWMPSTARSWHRTTEARKMGRPPAKVGRANASARVFMQSPRRDSSERSCRGSRARADRRRVSDHAGSRSTGSTARGVDTARATRRSRARR